MKTGIPVFIVLLLVSNNSAAKINHELETLVNRKVEASVERYLTSMKMAEADDSTSRFEDLEYDYQVIKMNLKENIKNLNQKLAEVHTEAAVQKSALDTQMTDFLKTWQDVVGTFPESVDRMIEDRLKTFSANAQAPTGSGKQLTDDFFNGISKIKDAVAKLQIVQKLMQTKQSEMNDQIGSNIELGESLSASCSATATALNYQKDVNQEQSKRIAKLETFQALAVNYFQKINSASNKVLMVEEKVDSVDAEMLKIRNAFKNQLIPALQSVFEDKVVEETSVHSHPYATVYIEETTAYTRVTEPEIMTRPVDTTRPETTGASTTTPIPTPPGWKTPGEIPTTEQEPEIEFDTTETKTTAQLEKTTTPIPTPPGWKTPGDILTSEDGSGIIIIEANTRYTTTHEMETTKNGEKTTTRIPEIDEIESRTNPEISDSKILEATPEGWSTPGDVTSVKNGSGSNDLSESSDDEEFRETEMPIIAKSTSESTDSTLGSASESSKANIESRIKNHKLTNSIRSIFGSISLSG